MILAAAVLLAALAGSADPLAGARDLFTQGDYGAAEAAALAAATPPREGAALYLAGLARFRAGQPGPALDLIERAGRAADAPDRGAWQFNRAACLYDLGRFEEAEQAFAEAAALAPSLAALALVNAGFAALDGGAPDRARQLAERARVAGAAAPPPALAELEDALAGRGGAAPSPAVEAHQAGLAAYDAGRFQEAREQFRRAAALGAGTPAGARSALMAGAASLALGERAEARDQFARLLAGPLEEADRRLAADYLDAASYGLAARGAGWEGGARAGAGRDSNVPQSGAVEQQREAGAGRIASAFLAAGAGLARRWRLGDGQWAQLGYGVDQVAYLASAAEDYSLQQHLLGAALEAAVGPRLRLGIEGQGGLDLTGLSDFRGMQASAGGVAWGAWDGSDRASTRLDLAWTHRWALRQEFDYLGGDRVDVRLGEELRLAGATVELAYRWRDEAIGTLTQVATPNTFVLPQAYTSHALLGALRARLAPRLDLSLAIGHEWRTYPEARVEQETFGGTAVFGQVRREDQRTWAGAAAGLTLTRALALALRYDFVVNRSNATGPQGCPMGGPHEVPGGGMGGACSAWDDKNYEKHVLTLEAAFGW